MDRFWLITWRTYGSWLPGDDRGSVTRVRAVGTPRVVHNTPDTPMDGSMPGLSVAARRAMTGEPVRLTPAQASAVCEQFEETARFRGWSILAGAVMDAHAHLVVGVPGDPDPDKLLGDFKAWGSRRLNTEWCRRPNGTWWADGGSTRKLPTPDAVVAAVGYVWRQPGALRVWTAEGWEPDAANGLA